MAAALASFGAAAGSLALAAVVNAQTYSPTVLFTTSAYGSAGLPNFAAFPDLTVGSTGQSVYDLQGLLSELGYKSPTLATTYFGSITKSALSAYQRANGLPATGYFGSMTKAALSSLVSNTYARLTASGTVSNSGAVSTNGASVSMSLRPLSSTGYWYNGNWYNAVPASGTTDIAGYWNNGTWYPMNNSQNMSSSVAITNPSGGYWYNGVWYPTTTPNIGGNGNAVSQGTTNATSTGGVNSNGTYGMSTSLWSPYPGIVSGNSSSGGNANVSTCGWETTSSGNQYVCH